MTIIIRIPRSELFRFEKGFSIELTVWIFLWEVSTGTLDQLALHREEWQIRRKLSGDRWEENNQVSPNTLGKTMAYKRVKDFRFRKNVPKEDSLRFSKPRSTNGPVLSLPLEKTGNR